MRVVEITQPGGPDVLKLGDRPKPETGPQDILIRVLSAGVNRPDCFQRAGLYPPPPGASDLPGLEVSGHVEAVGPQVEGFAIGDPVVALTPGGGYADFVTAPSGSVLPAPKGVDLRDAAGIMETLMTVWSNVFIRAYAAQGDWLLVHGGSSGIGAAAIQLAKAFGMTVIATAGSSDKTAFASRLGADHVIDYKSTDFVEAVSDFTDGRGVDVVLDMVGGDYIPRNIACMAPDARHVSIAFLRGPKTDLDMGPVMRKRLTLTGSTLRPQSDAFKSAVAHDLRRFVWPLFEAGEISVPVHQRFPLEEAAKAHTVMESGAHMGKLLLDL